MLIKWTFLFCLDTIKPEDAEPPKIHITGTGGTYAGTMDQVCGICKEMFGYEFPEKIGKFFLKGYRYRAGKVLAAVGAIISQYHEERLKGKN